jgi:DNA polymerase III gamma/tau subunit
MFKHVVGQQRAVSALQSALKHKDTQAFILSGESGVGKTTLARICAAKLGCVRPDEIDAATYTGIDAMRDVANGLSYAPFEGEARVLILDESHALSRQAWDSLLKVVEEPPPNTYWFFCTTQPAKIPETIKTRCTHIQLKGIDKATLTDLVERVAEAEGIRLADGIRQVIVAEANGSARQVLTNLGLCRDARDAKSAAIILETAQESDKVLKLCRLLAQGGTWVEAMGIVEELDDINPEGVRIQVISYLAAAARKSKAAKETVFFLQRVEAFAQSYNGSDAKAQLVRSIGQCFYGS